MDLKFRHRSFGTLGVVVVHFGFKNHLDMDKGKHSVGRILSPRGAHFTLKYLDHIKSVF